jgi:molybdate transport system ATP-binding protein
VNAFALHAAYEGFTLSAEASWDAPAAALFGASGSGKTTIVETLAGLRPEVAGEITLRDRRVDGLAPERRRVGWVPQDASLFPHMTARQNLAFAARPRGGQAAMDRAVDALEIGPLLDRRATDLSGGERQRVAIARALSSAPDMLLLDEPLASIDRPLRARIVPFLAELPERTGVPMLLVSHDPLEVTALCRWVAVLSEGRVVAQGDPQDVFAGAAALGTLEALGAENLFEVSVVDRGGGMLHLRTPAGCEIQMAAVAGFPEPARVAVRSEDIMLSIERPGLVSAQNVLPGTVTELQTLGEHVYIRMTSGGEPWVAKVTTRAVQSLSLQPGRELHLLIKAHAVHPYSGREQVVQPVG